MNTTTNSLDIFNKISLRIIREQEIIIGPLAWDEARKVVGFKVVDSKNGEVTFEGDPKEILNRLVAQYERLFGKISHEVCRGAVQDLIAELPSDQIPSSLK